MELLAEVGMIINPKAGPTNTQPQGPTAATRFRTCLGDCEIRGLETTSREEFMQCAAELAREVDVLIVAGGDGIVLGRDQRPGQPDVPSPICRSARVAPWAMPWTCRRN